MSDVFDMSSEKKNCDKKSVGFVHSRQSVRNKSDSKPFCVQSETPHLSTNSTEFTVRLFFVHHEKRPKRFPHCFSLIKASVVNDNLNWMNSGNQNLFWLLLLNIPNCYTCRNRICDICYLLHGERANYPFFADLILTMCYISIHIHNV